MLPVIVFLVVWIALVGVWIAALVDASKYSRWAFRAAGRSRGGTIALVALTGWLGAGYYWLAIKRGVELHRDASPDPEEWFGELDYDVFYDDAEGWTWAHLRPRRNPSAVLRRYGRGHSPDEAVASAKRRWEVEQVG